jgi:putative flippase GtrA
MNKKIMNYILKFLLPYKQIIQYGIIGCICAGLDFLIYLFLTNIFEIPYLFANIISIHAGIFTSFFLNRHFTFKVKNKTIFRFFSFYLVGLIGLSISSGLLILFIEKMFIDELVSKAGTIIIVAVIQFFLNKYISFKHEK